ncbi:hypothetical protein NUW58_g10195 [Xylaria curta]|uniref:Uncharacterized protein n=1 Tax=Xylaria curta TaxID=42375 RepID=A0ACC1MPG9_9PEZI|nr:hypothetical protein NUW58_g10195 [Xylaria curta]
MAKAEEERRKQEEEKTRQETLRLEQRRIEQDILRTSLDRGIPPPMIPVVFAGMSGGTLSQATLELVQQFLPLPQQSHHAQILPAQGPMSPGHRRDSQQYGSYAGSAGVPPTPGSVAGTQAGFVPYQGPGSPTRARAHTISIGSAPARQLGALGSSALPRLSTGEGISGPPHAPHTTTQQQPPPPPQQGTAAQQETQSTQGLYFHYWQPPTSNASSSQQAASSGSSKSKKTTNRRFVWLMLLLVKLVIRQKSEKQRDHNTPFPHRANGGRGLLALVRSLVLQCCRIHRQVAGGVTRAREAIFLHTAQPAVAGVSLSHHMGGFPQEWEPRSSAQREKRHSPSRTSNHEAVIQFRPC